MSVDFFFPFKSCLVHVVGFMLKFYYVVKKCTSVSMKYYLYFKDVFVYIFVCLLHVCISPFSFLVT